MVSRGHAKRAAGALGLRHVKNPILLAQKILERGEDDLWGHKGDKGQPSVTTVAGALADDGEDDGGCFEPGRGKVDAPSAQGHTLVYGAVAEALARRYGLELLPVAYFFTQQRWDEHVRALQRERAGAQAGATWCPDEYLPQGTTGAVALDEDGVVCCATSTGGLTNKLTGRIGDTPVPGAGYWAEEWAEAGDPTRSTAAAATTMTTTTTLSGFWDRSIERVRAPGAALEFAGALRGLMADCLPTPFLYTPLAPSTPRAAAAQLTTTRSFATSGTGNGDSFLRVNAARTAAAIARWKPVSSAVALTEVTGPGGELQRSAGDRWAVTGEGEGGMIGIESVVVRNEEGVVVEKRSEVIQDHNSPGMFRAWVDDDDKAVFQVWHESDSGEIARMGFDGEGRPEDVRGEKMVL